WFTSVLFSPACSRWLSYGFWSGASPRLRRIRRKHIHPRSLRDVPQAGRTHGPAAAELWLPVRHAVRGGVLDGEARAEIETQERVGRAQSRFDGRGPSRAGIAREDEAQIARAFGPGGDVVVQARGDFQGFDAADARGFFQSFHSFEDSTVRHWDHHDAGGGRFAFEAAHIFAQ